MSISQAARAAPPYLAGLNPEQREAVETLDGPVLLLAGAGTGKTRALTTRLAHILNTGRARPWEILAVTFTNKAAREMKSRVGELIGEGVEGLPWLGTFHAIAAQILRRHAELAGLKPSFTILDTDDQIRLIKQILQAENIDDKRWTPRHLASLIDGWKNRGLTPDRLTEEDAYSFANGEGKRLYEIYQDRLGILNAADFGDLLLHNLTIFQNNPDVLSDFHRRFRYLMVDEYQDTNIAQYLWLRLLAQGSRNLCVVGDDDQSIYGWRGAEVDNILRFEKDFEGAKVIRLERNYRSTQHILSAASGLIAANKARLGKELWTDDEGGEKVHVRGVWDGESEARAIAEEIENWISKGGSYNDVAILVRASWQMRAFEDRFIMTGLPYRVIGGPRFFERAEIRDAHAYLRLVRQDEDDLAFERIVNTPKRGVGAKTLQLIQKLAANPPARVRTGNPLDEPSFDLETGEVVDEEAQGPSRISLMAATRILLKTDEIKGPARAGLQALLRDVENWRAQAEHMNHAELAEMILDESGYTAMWREDKSPQAAGRLDNLKELTRSMGEYDTLDAYLEHVSLLTDTDREEGEDEVSLMTLHSAKGLEFPLVMLPGWEEGVFPSQRSLDEGGMSALEEERRLAYVGITRARQTAMIWFAANRQIYGRWQAVIPSRFIDELPAEHVQAESQTNYFDSGPGYEGVKETVETYRSDYSSPGWKRMQAARGRERGRPPTIEAEAKLMASSDPSDSSGFAPGVRVFHDKFGYGRVVSADGAKLVVDFDHTGQKKVISSFLESA